MASNNALVPIGCSSLFPSLSPSHFLSLSRSLSLHAAINYPWCRQVQSLLVSGCPIAAPLCPLQSRQTNLPSYYLHTSDKTLAVMFFSVCTECLLEESSACPWRAAPAFCGTAGHSSQCSQSCNGCFLCGDLGPWQNGLAYCVLAVPQAGAA